jgi:glutamate-ammonia-ligase adenylyltransferase
MVAGESGLSPLSRPSSASGRLSRLGFVDVARAQRLLADPALRVPGDPEWDDDLGGALGVVVQALGDTADPDLALLGLGRIAEASRRAGVELVDELADDAPLRRRLLAVLGASAALADHLARHPEHLADLAAHRWAEHRPAPGDLRSELLDAVRADPSAPDPVTRLAPAAAADALRVAYRRRLLRVAARDLTQPDPLRALPDVAAELADLAGATLEAALAVARASLRPDAQPCRLAVIAMGKCGGRELNYVSDVDVIFVAEPVAGGDEAAALRTATELATRMMTVCGQQTGEGTIWPVDAALRPEGKQGPLVRTLASHVSYYRSWAKTWEFQALLKARPVAGDLDLGAAYVDAVAPLVWEAAGREGFVDDVRAMRRRVEEHIRPAEASRQLKLGPGGLRDVEFAVQLLQLVHGRGDVFLRSPTTLLALEQLSTHGYVGRSDAGALDRSYRFLRALEHRIQLYRLRRTHLVPDTEADLRRLGRSLGMRSDPVTELVDTWRREAQQVRRLHEKIFYRPLLAAVARLAGDEARLTPEAARDRLVALGYADPAAALRHLEALTAGLSRRAAIQRTLLPVMLGWFADGPDPDAGLLGFRQVSDALGDTPWFLRLLRDEGAAAERLARVLASSRFATELMLRAPDSITMLGDDAELVPRPREPLQAEVSAGVARHDDPVAAIGVVRAMRRRELFRIAVGDLVGQLDVDAVGDALTAVAQATVAAALQAAVAAIEAERRGPLPTRIAVVAMGRLGGCEMGYSSDADVMFVHEPVDGEGDRDAALTALAVAEEMRRLLALPSPEPPLLIDADLRPEGRQGPLVRTFASYQAYYARWGETWERQALLRAAPLAGDADLLGRFVALVDPLRYPAGGLDEGQVREIRRIKARVEAERLPRGADPTTHLKLGRGGLADVEWTVQLLQLQHAAAVPGLRTTRTPAALGAAVAAGLLAPEDRSALVAAWRTATAVRNTAMLVRNRPSDELPRNIRDLVAVSRVLGYGPGETTDFVEDYRRVTRRARAVVDRVFFGL